MYVTEEWKKFTVYVRGIFVGIAYKQALVF